MENNSSGTTAAGLLAKIKHDSENAAALKAYWESALPVPPPAQFELMQMVRDLGLDYLSQGIDAYAAELSKKERVVAEGKEPKYAITTQNAKSYVCGTAHNIREKDDPRERPPTERRRRRSMVASDPNWSSEAYHTASPEERKKAMGTLIAEEKTKRKPQ